MQFGRFRSEADIQRSLLRRWQDNRANFGFGTLAHGDKKGAETHK
jgi:hypothetical protein